jgi:hypothetical protein
MKCASSIVRLILYFQHFPAILPQKSWHIFWVLTTGVTITWLLQLQWLLLVLVWRYRPLWLKNSSFPLPEYCLYISGRSPWMGDQHVARPLPTNGKQTEITHTSMPRVSWVCFGAHVPGGGVAESNTHFRPRDHCDRLRDYCWIKLDTSHSLEQRFTSRAHRTVCEDVCSSACTRAVMQRHGPACERDRWSAY